MAAFSKAMSNKNGIDIDAALQSVRAGGDGAPLNGGTGGNSDLVGLTDIAKSMMSQSSATMQSAQLQVRMCVCVCVREEVGCVCVEGGKDCGRTRIEIDAS